MTPRSNPSSAEGKLRRTLAAVLRPGPLVRKLALRVILFSSVLALGITAVELTYEYLKDLRQIDGRMAQIRDAYLDSVTENVWVADRERIDTQLLGITRLPDFVLAEIRVHGRTEQQRGPGLSGPGITHVFELERLHQGRLQHIGQLVVAASYQGAYRRVLERAIFYLVSNGAKTLLVALFLFVIYYRLIGVHLEKMGAYALAHGHARDAEPLRLERSAATPADELSSLVAALNHMRDELVQRTRAQQQQMDTLAEQAALLDLAHDAILVRDLDNRILFWNRGAQATYGWTAEQALGKTVHQLLQTNAPESLINIEDMLLRTGQWEGELGHTAKSGTRIVVASRWAVRRNEAGVPVAVMEINRKVSERQENAGPAAPAAAGDGTVSRP